MASGGYEAVLRASLAERGMIIFDGESDRIAGQ